MLPGFAAATAIAKCTNEVVTFNMYIFVKIELSVKPHGPFISGAGKI